MGACSWVLSGCGSAASVLQMDADVARDLRKQKTYCQSIPRIYSGLAFDFCVLNAPPDPTGVLLPFVLLDLPLSEPDRHPGADAALAAAPRRPRP
mgnify:CR=1 FL=1